MEKYNADKLNQAAMAFLKSGHMTQEDKEKHPEFIGSMSFDDCVSLNSELTKAFWKLGNLTEEKKKALNISEGIISIKDFETLEKKENGEAFQKEENNATSSN